MNEDPREQQEIANESRVSTSDSYEVEVQEDQDQHYPDLTMRNMSFEDIDMEQASLQDQHQEEDEQIVEQSGLFFNLGRSFKKCIVGFFFALTMCFYHVFTTLILLTEILLLVTILFLYIAGIMDLTFAIWFFMSMSMIFVILKMCLSHILPDSNDVASIFQERGASNELPLPERMMRPWVHDNRVTYRRATRPQSLSQRRLGGRYSSRRFTESQNDGIQLHELNNPDSHRQSQLQQVRIGFSPNNSHDEMRIRREQLLRNELFRTIFTRAGMQRHGGIHNHLIVLQANLQMMRLQGLGREFNENDFDFLSQLDSSIQGRHISERTQCLISQLPTYSFQEKQKSVQFKDQDEPSQECDDNQNVPNEKLTDGNIKTYSCSICIEQFVDEDMVKILPCFHQFHAKCVDDWLLRKQLCPVCKFDINVDENPFSGEAVLNEINEQNNYQ